MGNPGGFNPRGEDWIGRELAAIRGELRELRAADPFAPMGMKPVAGGVEIKGSLSLPAGIINNDALTSPSVPYAAHADVASFALAPGANVEKLALTVPVPAGFTRAHVFAAATMYAYNSNASRDEMYMQCLVNGVRQGYSSMVSAPGSSIGFAGSNYAAVLTNVGSTFKVSVVASSNAFTWPADPTRSSIDLNVFVTFLR